MEGNFNQMTTTPPSAPENGQAALTALPKKQYKLAQHAIRNLKANGSTVMGHDYFLRRIRLIPISVLEKAWATL